MSEPSCPGCGESPMFRSVVHGCCEQAIDLRATLREVLSRFTEQGHPGRPCLRTPWLNVETVQAWRDVLAAGDNEVIR